MTIRTNVDMKFSGHSRATPYDVKPARMSEGTDGSVSCHSSHVCCPRVKNKRSDTGTRRQTLARPGHSRCP